VTEIQQNRYDQLIRRVNNIVAPGSMVGDSLNELFPVIDVERVPGELLILMGTNICFGGGTIAAVVGEAGTAQLFNPAGSNVLVTLTRVDFASTLLGTLRWGRDFTERGARVSTETFRDNRRPVVELPVANVRQDSAVALANATNQTRVLPNTAFVLEDENGVMIISPGSGFEIGTGTGNATTFFGFTWRERVAEASELNL